MRLSWMALQPWSGGCVFVRRWREIGAFDPLSVATAMASESTFGDCHIAERGYFCLRLGPDPSLRPVKGSGIERYDGIVRTLKALRADVLTVGPALRAAGIPVPDLLFDSTEIRRWMTERSAIGRFSCARPPSIVVRKESLSDFARRLGVEDK